MSHTYICVGIGKDVPVPLLNYCGSFRMPLYFVLSGLFFKEYGGLLDFARRKTNKLVIPFFFFHLLSVAIMFATSGFGVKMGNKKNISEIWAFVSDHWLVNGPLWFLLCLFVVNIYFYCIVLMAKKLSGGRQQLMIALIIGLSLVGGGWGFALGRYEIELWCYSDTALTCLPFFCAGYILRKFTNILYPGRWDKWWPLTCAVLLCITYFVRGGISYLENDTSTKPFVDLYAGGLCGTLAVLFFAKALHRLPVVSYWGRYSIIILCTHFIIIKLLDALFASLGIAALLPPVVYVYGMLALTMVVCTAIIPLCIRYIPWFTAQKDLFPHPLQK